MSVYVLGVTAVIGVSATSDPVPNFEYSEVILDYLSCSTFKT